MSLIRLHFHTHYTPSEFQCEGLARLAKHNFCLSGWIFINFILKTGWVCSLFLCLFFM